MGKKLFDYVIGNPPYQENMRENPLVPIRFTTSSWMQPSRCLIM